MNQLGKKHVDGKSLQSWLTHNEYDISYLRVLLTLIKHKESIIRITFCFAILATIVSFLLPQVYRAGTRCICPRPRGSISINQFEQSGFVNSNSESPGVDTFSNLIAGIIKSRTVLDRIIERFQLLEVYQVEQVAKVRKKLSKALSVKVEAISGIITVSVEDKDPQRSAEMANAFVEELRNMVQKMTLTRAAQQRLFLAQQVKDVQLALLRSENVLKQYQVKTGILNVDTQTSALMKSIGVLRAQVSAKEVELRVAQAFTTSRNPEAQKLKTELNGLKAELRKLEARAGDSEYKTISLNDLPSDGLEYLRKLRDVRFNESLYETLLGEYETAKIREANEPVVIQIIDRAIEPHFAAKPNRILIIAITIIAGFFMSIMGAAMREILEATSKDPSRKEEVAMIKEYRRIRWGKLFLP